MKYITGVLLSLFLLFAQNVVFSQGENNSPYKCISNHLNYLNQHKPELAAKSFYVKKDTSKAIDLAVKLKKVYDGMGLFVPVNKVPDNPDYIDSLSKKHRYVIFSERLPHIYVEKINNNWYYSPDSYDEILKLYKEVYPFGDDLLQRIIPSFGNKKALGLYIWQYIGFLVIIIISILLYFIFLKLLKPILVFLIDKILRKHLELPVKYEKTTRVFSLLLVFSLMKYAFALLKLPIKISSFLTISLDIVDVVLLSFLIYRIFDIILEFLSTLAKATSSKMDDQVLPIIRQIVKILIITGAVIKFLILLNINVTALIAGVSIGGLALALAAQDTVKNLIGSLMIFIDKPFQVDDWVEIDNMAGTVTEVGFRSTRIKQLDTSIISIPNGIISNKALTNKGLRVFRLFETTIGLTYDTPRLQLQYFIDGLRKIAIKHDMISENYYIYLKDLGDFSINILFRVYLKTNDYKHELALKEEITFLIMELAETLNVRFAFPSQTIYVEQFPGKENLIPQYDENIENLKNKLNGFLDKL
jgi:MscS family membrane protein